MLLMSSLIPFWSESICSMMPLCKICSEMCFMDENVVSLGKYFMWQLKKNAKSYIFIQQIFWGLQALDTASQIMLINCSEEWGYVRVFATEVWVIGTSKDYCCKRKVDLSLFIFNLSQIKELSTVLYVERCKSLYFLKPFLWYAPQLSMASTLCFLILSLLRAKCGGDCRSWHSFFPAWVPSRLLGVGAAL